MKSYFIILTFIALYMPAKSAVATTMDSSAISTQIIPINWKRFDNSYKNNKDISQSRQMPANMAQYNLAWNVETFKLDDFFIVTTMNSINSELVIQNSSKQNQETVIDLVLSDINGKTFLHLPKQTHILTAGEYKKIKFSKKQLQPQLWSPEHPVLYTMKISVKINNKEVACDIRKIGFKSFEIRGHLFYLNGKPYYLRGLSQWPVSRVIDKNGKTAPDVWEDEGFVKRFFEKAKELNINAGRIGDNDLWVKYADEMGILNIAGSYSGAGAKEESVFKRNRDDFTPKILKLRNHVSTAIYTLSNEINWGANPNFISLSKENYEFARTLDPTHPMIANAGFGNGKVGDIEDIHDYTGWYGGTVLDMVKYEENDFFKKSGGAKQPVTFTECVGTYTGERNGRFHLWYNKGMSNALRHVGRGGQHPDDPLWYQKIITKEMMEGMRRARAMDSRISGSFPYSDFWRWNVPGKSFTTKPATEVIRQVYSPILLSLKCWNRHVFAGGGISGELYVVNDDVLLGDLTNATATISLVQNDKTLISIDVAVPLVKYYTTVKIPVSLSIPGTVEAGAGKIVMTLKHEKARSIPNDMDLFIAPREFAKSSSDRTVALYDPEGSTIKALKSIGLNFNVISDIESVADGYLIIGARSLSTLSKLQTQDVLKFTKVGGKVLVLEQKADQLNNSSLIPEGVRTKAYQSLYVNTERMGLLDKGLANRDFFLWNQSKNASSFPVVNVFDIRADMLDKFTVLANCGHMLQYPVVLEYFDGKGSIIFSQFEFVDRVQHDPVAAKVFENIIGYLQTEGHTFGPQLKADVIFADLDSEAGLFAASLKQGIVLNGHNYGKVSWKKYGWPEGRRIVGEQKVINALGYIGPVLASDTARGFFYLRPPAGTRTLYLEVKNPVKKQLWFRVYLNDRPAGDVVITDAHTVQQYGPWQIPGDKADLKVTIESQSDPNALRREKPIIEELVFQKMIFK